MQVSVNYQILIKINETYCLTLSSIRSLFTLKEDLVLFNSLRVLVFSSQFICSLFNLLVFLDVVAHF